MSLFWSSLIFPFHNMDMVGLKMFRTNNRTHKVNYYFVLYTPPLFIWENVMLFFVYILYIYIYRNRRRRGEYWPVFLHGTCNSCIHWILLWEWSWFSSLYVWFSNVWFKGLLGVMKERERERERIRCSKFVSVTIIINLVELLCALSSYSFYLCLCKN